MTINWYGQACFRLESKDVKLLIDPFSKELGLRVPRMNDTIYLVTHDHYDHNNIGGVDKKSFVVTGPGEYEKAGVQIVGVQSFHDNEEGIKRGYNTIYVVTIDGIRVCHMGDIGQTQLTDEQLSTIGDIDILMIPVGGIYTVDGKQATKLVSQLQPKIVIPMHYKIKGLKEKLDDEKVFVKEIGMKPETVDTFKITKKNLPSEETQLIVFNLK